MLNIRCSETSQNPHSFYLFFAIPSTCIKVLYICTQIYVYVYILGFFLSDSTNYTSLVNFPIVYLFNFFSY